MLLRIRKAGALSSSLYQWTAGKRWYWINRKNMELEGTFELQRNLFNAVLAGLMATVKGSYDRAKKKLRLVL